MTRPNAELAWRVMDHINAHRAAFNMADWWDNPDEDPVTLEDLVEECGTTACFGGWAIALSGYTMGRGVTLDGEAVCFSYSEFAQKLLGLSDTDASYLFYVSNDEIDRAVVNVFGPRPDIGEVVDHGPVKPPYGTPEREAYDRENGAAS